MLNNQTDTIMMTDGTEVFFSIKKDNWHWCVYKHTKNPDSSHINKDFNQWYFTKIFAQRRAESMYRHYNKMNEKMKFEQRYLEHLEVILEKKDDTKL